MRVLMLSTSLPPFAESQTIRNVFLLRGLVRRGATVDVITGPAGAGDWTLEALLPDWVRVLRTPPALYDRVQGRIARLGHARLGGLLRAACAIGAGKLLAPDVRRGWDGLALEAARCLARPDLIVSSAGSPTAHLAAAELARRWATPWLAEYGDPWSHNPLPPASHFHIRHWNARLERRALAQVAALSVTTRQTAAVLTKWLGKAAPPVEVIPCGYSRPRGEWRAPGPGPVRVLYAGTASRGSRDLRAAMRALDAAARRAGRSVELELVGSLSPAFLDLRPQLEAVQVRPAGWVSYAQSVERMRAAGVLLLVGNSQPLQVPGKVFNYLASGRPVAYWGQLEAARDPTLEWVAGMPGVAILAPGGDAVAAWSEVLEGLDGLAAQARERQRHPRLAGLEWDEIGDRFAAWAWLTAGAGPLPDGRGSAGCRGHGGDNPSRDREEAVVNHYAVHLPRETP